jgi:hypothetical protein
MVVFIEHAPSYATVKRWDTEFLSGTTSLEDEPQSGCPSVKKTVKM